MIGFKVKYTDEDYEEQTGTIWDSIMSFMPDASGVPRTQYVIEREDGYIDIIHPESLNEIINNPNMGLISGKRLSELNK